MGHDCHHEHSSCHHQSSAPASTLESCHKCTCGDKEKKKDDEHSTCCHSK